MMPEKKKWWGIEVVYRRRLTNSIVSAVHSQTKLETWGKSLCSHQAAETRWYKIDEEMVCAVIHPKHVYKQSRKVL